MLTAGKQRSQDRFGINKFKVHPIKVLEVSAQLLLHKLTGIKMSSALEAGVAGECVEA